jgi:hypothetical protein
MELMFAHFLKTRYADLLEGRNFNACPDARDLKISPWPPTSSHAGSPELIQRADAGDGLCSASYG